MRPLILQSLTDSAAAAKTFIWLVVFSCILISTGASAQQTLPGGNPSRKDIEGSVIFRLPEGQVYRFFTLTFQNDVFVGDDDGYTNGLGLTFGRGPFLEFSNDNLPGWLNFLTQKLYIRTMPNKVRGVAHLFFQQMQTPEEIGVAELQEDDVPYAGLLSTQSIFYAWDRNTSDQFSVFLGLVGPASQADKVQTEIHDLVDADEPLGWPNQLSNEPVFRLEARRATKVFRNYEGKYGYDIIGLGTIGLGNLRSSAHAGLALRWGTNLEFSHATFSLQTDKQVNSLSLSPRNDFFLYAGAEFGVVFNDILIDGNTFEDSHSVPLEHFQTDATIGAVWKRRNLSYVFQISSLNSRTSLKSDREAFGAFSITYAYR